MLDLGTGTGANLELFPPTVDELVLSEPSSNMARALARRLGQQGKGDLEVVQAPAEALPFDAGSFDYVTCTMVMCTMPDPKAGLREVARVLRPGGSCSSSTSAQRTRALRVPRIGWNGRGASSPPVVTAIATACA